MVDLHCSALKSKGNTPKYGLIFHSGFIGRASAKDKGRISRYLANKCSIASRFDLFSDVPSSCYGEKLKEQVEERLEFYNTGHTPRKNAEVMEEAKHDYDRKFCSPRAELMGGCACQCSILNFIDLPCEGVVRKQKKKQKKQKKAVEEAVSETPKKSSKDKSVLGKKRRVDDIEAEVETPKKQKKSNR